MIVQFSRHFQVRKVWREELSHHLQTCVWPVNIEWAAKYQTGTETERQAGDLRIEETYQNDNRKYLHRFQRAPGIDNIQNV